VDADDVQTGHLLHLFGFEVPGICAPCIAGMMDDADGWLQDKLDQHRDNRSELRGAIETVEEMFDRYSDQIRTDDAFRFAPEELGSLDKYQPRDPDVLMELVLLDLFRVWLDLQYLVQTSPGFITPDPEYAVRSEQNKAFQREYWRLLDRLCQLHRDIQEGRLEAPPEDDWV
jgi:hypothetical protein